MRRLLYLSLAAWVVAAVQCHQTSDRASDATTTEHLIYGCPVNHTRPCVPKCCDVQQSYSMTNRSVCTYNNDTFLPEFVDCPSNLEDVEGVPMDERYEYFIGNPCTNGKYMLDPEVYEEDSYLMYSNGSLFQGGRIYSMGDYCVESLEGENRVFVCFDAAEPPPLKFQYILYPIGLLVSIPFLLVTAAIYLGIDAFRDLLGQALSCQVICLAIAYFFLAIVQLGSDNLNGDLCIAAAFIIQFFFVACFFWLNVISYDIYRNLRIDFRRITSDRKSEKLKFVYYSLYAWYGPFMLTIVSLVMDLEPTVPEFLIKPRFGVHSCWFNSDTAALPYFYGPVGLLILINVVLFLLSARIIHKEQKNAARKPLRDSGLSDVEIPNKLRVWIKSFKQCVALFLIMGVNWIAEIVSWAVGGSEVVWLVSDVFNTFQGLIIFYLFVIKPRKVHSEVRKRLDKLWGKISRCDLRYDEEAYDRRSDHWHADITLTEGLDPDVQSEFGSNHTKISQSDE